MTAEYTVTAHSDDETKTWWTDDQDIRGLCCQADSFQDLVENILVLAPELLRDDGVEALGAVVVIKIIGGGHAATRIALVVPPWVPAAVRKVANQLLQSSKVDSEDSESVRRLALDVRMRRVWSELLRRCSNRTYYYAPRFAAAVCNPNSLSCRIPAGALRIPEWFGLEERQAYALIELFSAAATLVSFAPPAVTESELNGEYGCRRLTEAAARLRTELQELDKLGIDPSERAVIIGLAHKYEWRAEHFRQQFPIVERHRADANVKGYVDALACAFIRIFGKLSVKIVTTLAKIAMGRDDISLDVVKKALERAAASLRL